MTLLSVPTAAAAGLRVSAGWPLGPGYAMGQSAGQYVWLRWAGSAALWLLWTLWSAAAQYGALKPLVRMDETSPIQSRAAAAISADKRPRPKKIGSCSSVLLLTEVHLAGSGQRSRGVRGARGACPAP